MALQLFPRCLRTWGHDDGSPWWIRTKGAFQPVRVALRGSSVWLSEKPEMAQAHSRTENASPVSAAERFQRLLRPFNSFGASLLMALCLAAALIAPSVLVGLFASAQGGSPGGTGPGDFGELGGSLMTVAEILSGVSGILFAVIVFGIQFHGERLGPTSFLVRYFGRREAVLPLAAVTLAVVGANVLVSLVACWRPAAALPIAALDLVMVPAVLIVALWLLHRMIASVSGDFLDDAMVSWLLWEYSRTVQEEVRVSGFQTAFAAALHDLGCRPDRVDAVLRRISGSAVQFHLRRRGRVTDVNLPALSSLVSLARSTWGLDVEIECSITAGGAANSAAALRLFIPRQSNQGAAPEVTIDQRAAIQRALQKVFRVSRDRHDDFPEVMGRFTEALATQASHERADQWGRGLAVLERLIAFRLEHPDLRRVANAVSPSLPSYFGELRLFDMARSAVQTDDRDKILLFLRFVRRIMGRSVRGAHIGLFLRAGQVLDAMYGWAVERPATATWFGRQLDEAAHFVTFGFEFCNPRGRDDELVLEQMPLAEARLHWLIGLVRAAVEADRSDDARHFHDRIFQWDALSRFRRSRPRPGKGTGDAIANLLDAHSFAEIIVGAWCVYVARSHPANCGAAVAVARQVIEGFDSQSELLRVWEHRPDPEEGGGLAAAASWSLDRRPLRAGEYRFDANPSGWMLDGFVALLLAKHNVSRGRTPHWLRKPPVHPPPAEAVVNAAIASALDDAHVREEVLGINEASSANAARTITDLLAGRRRRSRIRELREVVACVVTPDRVEAIRRAVVESLPGKREWLTALTALGSLDFAADAWSQSALPARASVPKQFLFREGEDAALSLGSSLAEALGRREAHAVVGRAEQVAESIGTLTAMVDVTASVEGALETLQRLGFQPSIIVLPHQDRFAWELFRVPDYRAPGRGRLGPLHLGDWSGYQVFQFPFEASSSLLVIDAGRFFGKLQSEGSDAVQVVIDDPHEAAHRAWASVSDDEPDDGKVHDPVEVVVRVIATLSAALGIHDEKAAVRIALDASKVGYGMNPADRLYHRPSCRLLFSGAPVQYSMAPLLHGESEHRHPCDVCRPDEWDFRSPDEFDPREGEDPLERRPTP